MTDQTEPEQKSRVDRLTDALLADRARQAERHQKKIQEQARTTSPPLEFDPYETRRWRVIAGPNPGHLPTTPMRRGPDGFFIHCKACNVEFESLGPECCQTCSDLPVEERFDIKPPFIGRACQAPGCETRIPRSARTGTKFCSPACRQRGRPRSKDKTKLECQPG